MSEAIVKVEHLSHRYSVQWAVRDINFEIGRRGITGLLGSNGAGKSTIMNIICGVLSQTEGTVTIAEHDMRTNPVEAKRHIGFLPQKPPLYEDLTVDEFLAYAAGLHLVPKREIPAAVEAAKQQCGLAVFGKRLIRNLSGGYQQRVGIAQAIIHSPEFVVLDEPTNGLDPNQILDIRRLISEIAKDRAILISTHILSEVQATCENILMVEHGNLVFNGTLAEFDSYVEPNSFVLKLSREPAEDDILSIAGVSRFKPISDYAHEYRVWFDGDRETLSRTVARSVEKGWGLVEITVEKSSIDEVFAQLSGRNK